jgi:glycosyltransferase involved in cell wall biosynthesis
VRGTRKKILFIIDSFALGGSQEFIVNFARNLKDYEVDVVHLFGDNDYRSQLEQEGCIRFESVFDFTPKAKWIRFLCLPLVFIRFLMRSREIQRDYHWINVRLPLSLLFSCLIGLGRSSKCHFTVDCDYRQLNRYEQWVFACCLSRFRSIGISSAIASTYSSIGLKSSELRDDLYFVSPRVSDNPIVYEHPFNLLFISRLVPQKALGDALEIMRFINADSSETIALHVIGDGPDRAGAELFCKQHGLKEVCFYGFRTDLNRFFVNADGLIKTAVGEPANSVARETILAGKVLFTTVESDIDRQLVANGSACEIFRTDPALSAIEIRRCIESTERILHSEDADSKSLPDDHNSRVANYYREMIEFANS